MNKRQENISNNRADLEEGSLGAGEVRLTGIQAKRGRTPNLKLTLPERFTPETSTSAVHFNDSPLRNEALPPYRGKYVAEYPLPGCSLKDIFSKIAQKTPVHDVTWISKNFTKTQLKPVLRCAIAAWIAMLLVIIASTQRLLGQSSFLILIAAFMSPPSGPFVAVLERELIIQLTVVGSFAWSCIGVRVANIARSEYHFDAISTDILHGKYIEAGPSIICAVFLCLGTSILLYTRARMGQGKPVIPALILSFTAMDSTLTLAAFYPYPFYVTGESVVVPIAFHSAISLFCALLIFPESVHGQFRTRFSSVFLPIADALRSQPDLLTSSLSSLDSNAEAFNKLVIAAESALGPLAATSRLMKKDISWGRFGADDFKFMHELSSRMTVRTNGMAFYFKIMDPSRHRFQCTPSTSVVGTPINTPALSQATSPASTPGIEERSPTNSRNNSLKSRRRRHHHHNYFNLHTSHGHSSLFHEVLNRPLENAVGVFESQKYLNLETRFSHPGADVLLSHMMQLLSESTHELLLCCADSIDHFVAWLQRVNDDRAWKRFIGKRTLAWEDAVAENEEVISTLKMSLSKFRQTKRHRVLDLYRSSMDPHISGYTTGEDPPPHRYLFQCYLYQYHLIHLSLNLIELLSEVSRLEYSRQHCRLWLPDSPMHKLLSWSKWDAGDNNMDPEDDEDPEIITGSLSENVDDIGMPHRRDPDALSPRGYLGAICFTIFHAFNALGHGNAIFAFKGGVVAALLSLPSFLPHTAAFATRNRFVWAIVLGQTTLSRFRGDTVFGLISRIWATFLGGLVGLILWYISTGKGSGNPYGLAAVTAICFPFFIFARLYYPAPPITDSHLPSIANAGWGLQVAWKRFALVSIGVTAAFVFSLFPPTTTLRKYLRLTYATTVERIGQLYCDIVSFATIRDKLKTRAIVQNLVAVRMKLNRTRILRRNVSYEFSLRGSWPEERYKRILDLQMEIAYLLSHLRSVEEHLEPDWARAFLRRTRFLESDFQGDVLAVISMISTALRTGTPLPQITPCPLLDRFVANHQALIAARGECETDYNIPQNLTIETLENEQYLCFSVGVATAFGIVSRLDRLMLATKELVGEQYHIHGIVNTLVKNNTEKMLL